jgi:hypothetical protein
MKTSTFVTIGILAAFFAADVSVASAQVGASGMLSGPSFGRSAKRVAAQSRPLPAVSTTRQADPITTGSIKKKPRG